MRKAVYPFLLATLLALPAYAQETPAKSSAITVTGQTEPSQKVEVPSVLRGQIVRLAVKEGQPIKKGDAIAQLDDEIQKQTVALAKLAADSTVEIRAAQTQVDYAQNELERFQKIAATASPAELRQKELNLKQAQLELEKRKEDAVKKGLELAREDATLARMTIRSPLDGSVLRLHKQEGEQIDTDKPLAVIVQTAKLNARFYPPKELFGKIKVGDTITVELKTQPASTRPAKIIAVDPTLDAASQLFQVKAELDNADQKIPAGSGAVWVWPTP